MTRRKTHEEYIAELAEKNIDWTPIEQYVTSATPILHVCPKGHQRLLRPNHVLRRNYPCRECFPYKVKRELKSHDTYVQQLKDRGITTIPVEKYKGCHTHILHRCVEGHEWMVTPNALLQGKNSKGCRECHFNEKRFSHADYLEKLREKEIVYEPLEQYTLSTIPILHKCPKGHEWYARPSAILDGSGCPSCAPSGFDFTKPAILYYFKINEYYKIGITNRTLKERYYSQVEEFDILFEVEYETGEEAYRIEQGILRDYADYRVTVPGLLRNGGNTELFSTDIFQVELKNENL